jgi:CheY-like chemotaxis protein
MVRILVVDDDAHMRDVLELLLASNDRHVDGVGSGQVALGAARAASLRPRRG